MAQSQPVPESPQSELQPPCPTCGVPMWLVRLSKFDGEQDLRTFKCQVCEHTESMVVKFK
jgi:formate dehydrogenase maturation protein FdhE